MSSHIRVGWYSASYKSTIENDSHLLFKILYLCASWHSNMHAMGNLNPHSFGENIRRWSGGRRILLRRRVLLLFGLLLLSSVGRFFTLFFSTFFAVVTRFFLVFVLFVGRVGGVGIGTGPFLAVELGVGAPLAIGVCQATPFTVVALVAVGVGSVSFLSLAVWFQVGVPPAIGLLGPATPLAVAVNFVVLIVVVRVSRTVVEPIERVTIAVIIAIPVRSTHVV